MKKIKKTFLVIFVLLLILIGLINEDFVKFLLSGQSDTYNVILVRHNYSIIIGISIITVLSIFYYDKRKLIKYLMIFCLVFLVISLRTFAVIKKPNKIVVISGLSFIPLKKCEIKEHNDCGSFFDFFLNKKVDQIIEDK